MTLGISLLPNQRHRIVSRKGGYFTLMVVGQSGLGKTTFINTLFNSLMKDKRKHKQEKQGTVTIDVTRLEVEEKGFQMKLNIIDTPGFGDYMNNENCWVPIRDFIDKQHQTWLQHETSESRLDKDDLRVHVVVYFMRPSGHVNPLDIRVMKELGNRVNLVPVIAKGDTISKTDLQQFKARLLDVVAQHDIKVYTPPVDGDPDEEAPGIISAMPFSVIGSTSDVHVNGQLVKGRQYSWGVAEVENENHCDFVKLRKLLIRTHMYDLIHSTRDHYEQYRLEHYQSMGKTDDAIVGNTKVMQKMKQDEEALRKKFTEQVRLEEARFRKWEQNLIQERDRLNKDLEDTHKVVKDLEREVEELMASK